MQLNHSINSFLSNQRHLPQLNMADDHLTLLAVTNGTASVVHCNSQELIIITIIL